MYIGRTVFSQLMDLFPLRTFQRCVERYRGNYKMQRLSCLDQFLALAFAQLTRRESLRDIEATLRAAQPRLYHMGTDAHASDVSVLDQLPLEPGAFYVMNRGYIHFKRLYRFVLGASFFLVRARANLQFRRRYSHAVDKTTGLRADQTVVLAGLHSSRNYPAPIRRVRFVHPERKAHLRVCDQQVFAAGADHHPALPTPLESGTLLQMDQAAFAHPEPLRHFRERGQDADLLGVKKRDCADGRRGRRHW